MLFHAEPTIGLKYAATARGDLSHADRLKRRNRAPQRLRDHDEPFPYQRRQHSVVPAAPGSASSVGGQVSPDMGHGVGRAIRE